MASMKGSCFVALFMLLGFAVDSSLCTGLTVDTLAFVQKWQLCTDPDDCPSVDENGNAQFLIDSILPLAMGAKRPTENCNISIDFDLDQLEPIMDQLQVAWPDWPQTDDNVTAWQKEWEKHGSCIADEVDELSNELDYFTQALDWKTQFPFAEFLKESYIYPGRSIPARYIIKAFDKGLNPDDENNQNNKVSFSLNCKIVKGYTGPVLSEVAVCFDGKTLEPKSCGKLFGGMQGSCPKHGSIWYPDPKSSAAPTEKVLFSPHSSMESPDYFFGTSVALVTIGAVILILLAVSTAYLHKLFNRVKGYTPFK